MAKIVSKPEHNVYSNIDDGPLMAPVIGANVDGKPNFMVGAYLGRIDNNPDNYHYKVAVRIHKDRYTLKGIRQTQGFSVNILNPAMEHLIENGFAGGTGAKVDKVARTGIKVFYGKMGNVPMVMESPVNYECSVLHTLDCGTHILIVGIVQEIHVEESCIENGKLRWNKVQPLYRLHINHLDDNYAPRTDTREYVAFKLCDEDSKKTDVLEVSFQSKKYYWQKRLETDRTRQ